MKTALLLIFVSLVFGGCAGSYKKIYFTSENPKSKIEQWVTAQIQPRPFNAFAPLTDMHPNFDRELARKIDNECRGRGLDCLEGLGFSCAIQLTDECSWTHIFAAMKPEHHGDQRIEIRVKRAGDTHLVKRSSHTIMAGKKLEPVATSFTGGES